MYKEGYVRIASQDVFLGDLEDWWIYVSPRARKSQQQANHQLYLEHGRIKAVYSPKGDVDLLLQWKH